MKKLITLCAVGMWSFGAQAQLTITDSLAISSISTLLEGIGVTVSNVTVNCAEHAMGHFIGTSELSITEGLLLTSGAADLVAGPSMNFATGYSSTGGDADIEAALGMGNITYDACALEFDCIPQGDTLLFNFSFGSEEYPEYVGSAFNDAFAIYLSGPGFPVATNVAAIPGGTIVSINNVNSTTNAGYFHDNEFPAGQYVAYDGFTTNLTVFAVVQPGQPYHFKVVVTDVGDQAFDSGVFLEAFSFRSPMLTTAVVGTDAWPFRVVVNGNKLVLETPVASSGAQVQVLDAAGRVMLTEQLTGERTTLDIGALPQGVFAVRVVDRGTQHVARFVKS
ncbi:MAG: choice-of-anchor L domain-containing protein [Flavobacteriales bacterium]